MKMVILCGVMLVLALGTAAQAKTWEDKEHHISFDLDEPAGWRNMGPLSEQNVLLYAVTPEFPPAKSLIVISNPAPESPGYLNREFIAAFLDGQQSSMKESGGKSTLLSQRHLKMDGVPAWEARFQCETGGQAFQQMVRVVIANGNIYSITPRRGSRDFVGEEFVKTKEE